MEKNFSCTSCGAPVVFKSLGSLVSVCSFCRSTLVRNDLNLSTLGKVAEVPDDISPFQIGTQGVFEGRNFEIIGKLKAKWENGFWNEWNLLFSRGPEGWLGEAMGQLTISFLHDFENISPGDVSVGTILDIDGKKFEADDIREAVYIDIKGEIPFITSANSKKKSVGFTGPGHTFATLEFFEREKPFLYVGRYVSFDECHFKSLRELDGWS